MIPKWKQVRWNKPSQHGHLVILVVWCIVLTDFEGDDILNLFSLWSLSLLLLDPFFMVSWFHGLGLIVPLGFSSLNVHFVWSVSSLIQVHCDYFLWGNIPIFHGCKQSSPENTNTVFGKPQFENDPDYCLVSPCQIALENWHPYHRTPVWLSPWKWPQNCSMAWYRIKHPWHMVK